jgi:dihydrofolate reductase
MRRLRYGVAASVDGYIAGPNGEADWIVMDPDIDFGAIARDFDTLLMGRRTYQAMAATGGGGGPFAGMSVVVASTTLAPGDLNGVTVVGAPLADAVTALKRAPGKDIWLFGGGRLCRALLDLGLVDRFEVAVIPVVLGGGVALVAPPATRTSLTLTDHRVYPKTGTVSLTYAVASARAARPGAAGRGSR